MFERDKEDLRELGVPLVTGSHSAWFEDELGLPDRPRRLRAARPRVHRDELAVLGLASRVWQQASLAGPAARALVKLKALGRRDRRGVAGRRRAAGPRRRAGLRAALRGHPRPRARHASPTAPGEAERRRPGTLEPWALTSRGGRWYVVGHDRDRGASAPSGSSRIDGRRPAGRPGGLATRCRRGARRPASWSRPPGTGRRREAVLRVRAGAPCCCAGGRPPSSRRRTTGWDVVRRAGRRRRALAEEMAGHGPDVVALEPADVRAGRARPRRRLRAATATARRVRAPPAGRHVTAASAERLSRAAGDGAVAAAPAGRRLARRPRHFGITERQLVDDLELLFVCGTPGHLPDDLIEADWEAGEVYLGNADAISRPLRLASTRRVALLVGLRTLARGARACTTATRSTRPWPSSRPPRATRRWPASACPPTLGRRRPGARARSASGTALRRHRRLHLRYLVPSRDEATERDVDPMRVLTVDGRWYLEGWCHRAEGVRLFRLDRIEARRGAGRRRHAAGRRRRARRRRAACSRPSPGGRRRDGRPRARRRAGWPATTRWSTSPSSATGRLRVTLRAADRRLGAAPGAAPRRATCASSTPPELADEVRRRASAALAAYPEASPNS